VPMWFVAPLEMNEGNSLGQGYNRPTGCSAEKAAHATFNFFLYFDCPISCVVIGDEVDVMGRGQQG